MAHHSANDYSDGSEHHERQPWVDGDVGSAVLFETVDCHDDVTCFSYDDEEEAGSDGEETHDAEPGPHSEYVSRPETIHGGMYVSGLDLADGPDHVM